MQWRRQSFPDKGAGVDKEFFLLDGMWNSLGFDEPDPQDQAELK
jgi:hypothetical protein